MFKVLLLFVAVSLMMLTESEGIGMNWKNKRVKNNHILKTIQSEDGDIIDCYHITKQPSLTHPSLKNHILKTKPSSYLSGITRRSFKGPKISHGWHKSGSCPTSTVPILRAKSYNTWERSFPQTSSFVPGNHHYQGAQAYVDRGPYNGVFGDIYVWGGIHVEPDEFSLNFIEAGNSNGTYVVQFPDLKLKNRAAAGYGIYPALFGDNKPRLFTYWSKGDGTGCYNLNCKGFIQIHRKFVPGAVISNVSVYNDQNKQFSLSLTIARDIIQRVWWLYLYDELVGYWPLSIFDYFGDAEALLWGGVVYSKTGGPTPTQLGSGHYPAEGFSRTGLIRQAFILDNDNIMKEKSPDGYLVTKPTCYDIKSYQEAEQGRHDGYDFLYGGPGSLSPYCSN